MAVLHTGLIPEAKVCMISDYILVAEDNVAVRRFLADALSQEGFNVRTAVDGIDALEQCGRELPRLLIADLQMPRLGGAELVAELETRNLGCFPVIVVSGREDLLGNAPSLVAHVEPEPIKFERLLAQVRVLLAN